MRERKAPADIFAHKPSNPEVKKQLRKDYQSWFRSTKKLWLHGTNRFVRVTKSSAVLATYDSLKKKVVYVNPNVSLHLN